MEPHKRVSTGSSQPKSMSSLPLAHVIQIRCAMNPKPPGDPIPERPGSSLIHPDTMFRYGPKSGTNRTARNQCISFLGQNLLNYQFFPRILDCVLIWRLWSHRAVHGTDATASDHCVTQPAKSSLESVQWPFSWAVLATDSCECSMGCQWVARVPKLPS